MARIDSFLRVVVEQAASDLHLSSGTVPAIRKDGELMPLPFRVVSEAETTRYLMEIITPEQQDRFEEEQSLDFLYEIPGVARFRGNLFLHARGVGSVFRIIPSGVPAMAQLQLPPVIRTLAAMDSGLILVCGPTGSGKTTTLAAIINEINTTKSAHIITVEDPIEFVHEGVRSVVSQRQVGVHVANFADAGRAALREAPDVLVFGELRDTESFTLALSAAEAGVLVLGTMHAASAGKAVHRIIDAFPGEQAQQALHVLAANFRGIVAQHLVPRSTGEGRLAVMEVLLNTAATAQLIRDNKVHQVESYLESGDHEGEGMFGLDAMLVPVIRAGTITLKAGLGLATRPDRVAELLGETSPRPAG